MKLKAMILSVVMALGVFATPLTAVAGFFPADRQTYTCTTPTQCDGADHVQFNSFTNNPVVGDERPFFAGSLNGANVQDRIKVKDGDEIVLRAYVHNNADPNKIGANAALAKNVKIKVLIPTAKQTDQNLVAFISASNASPAMINDTMSLYGDKAFNLQYVAGSAKFDHKADGINLISEKLNDTVVADGTYLGDMHGCFAYSGYVTLRVKVVMDKTPPPVSTAECKATDVKIYDNRKATVSVNTTVNNATVMGYKVDYGDGFVANTKDSSHTYAKDGTYRIVASVQVKYADGTTAWITSDACAKSVTFTTPTPGEKCKVPGKENLESTDANCKTEVTTVTPTSLPNTGAGSVAAIFGSVTALATLGYGIVSRRLSRQ